MQEKDWLALVAVHSDAWLLAVAFYFGARFGFDKADSCLIGSKKNKNKKTGREGIEMARNEWINGHLEAILDAGAGRGGVHGNNSSRSGNEKKRFEEKLRLEQFDHDIDKEKGDNKLISTTKYFVEEVVNGFDESDLYRTWIKLEACAHPFFDDLREPTTSLPNGRPLPPLFNFTPQELVGASPELRQRLILEHVRK